MLVFGTVACRFTLATGHSLKPTASSYLFYELFCGIMRE